MYDLSLLKLEFYLLKKNEARSSDKAESLANLLKCSDPEHAEYLYST